MSFPRLSWQVVPDHMHNKFENDRRVANVPQQTMPALLCHESCYKTKILCSSKLTLNSQSIGGMSESKQSKGNGGEISRKCRL